MVLRHRHTMKAQYKICAHSTQARMYQILGDIKFESVPADRLFYLRFSVLSLIQSVRMFRQGKAQGKFHPRTGHENPEGE